MTKRVFEAMVGAGILLLALGVYLWGIPAWVEPNDFAVVPPDLMPRTAVAAIGILGGLMSLHRLFLDPDRETPAPIDLRAMLMVGLLVAVFAVAVALMLYLGFLAGGVFVVAVLMVFMGQQNWWMVCLTSGLAPLLLYGFFDRLLGVPLP